MWETRSWRFPRKREIPRSWFLGDFPLPSFPPLAWIYETLLAGFDHPAGYFDSPTNSSTEPFICAGVVQACAPLRISHILASISDVVAARSDGVTYALRVEE